MDDVPNVPLSGKAMLGLFEEALRLKDAPPPPSPPDWLLDPDFGYRIDAFAGRGGSGFVWQATGKQDGTRVALKLIPFRGDPESLRFRWAAEVAALAALKHPNLVALRGQGIAPDGSAAWLALEWIEGTCLGRLLHREGPVAWRKALDFLLQASDGLSALHDAGLVHRDLKPANLLLEESTGRIVVADLGIALDLAGHPEGRLTRTLERAATPGYAPPEQFEADYVPHPAGDQYSLAVTLWELLTGSRPAGAFAKLHALAKVPPGLDAVLRRALNPRPAKRYPSIQAFAKALRRSTLWHAPFRKPLLLALLVLLPLGLAARHFLAPEPTPAVREIVFPMRIQSGDLPVSDGRNAFMNIDVTLQRDGKFAGYVHTFSRDPLFGFTGIAVLVFRDREGNIIDRQTTHPMGVNGKWVPGRRPHRVDDWIGDIGLERGARVADVEAFAMLADIPDMRRLRSSIEEFKDGLKKPDAYPTASELREVPDK